MPPKPNPPPKSVATQNIGQLDKAIGDADALVKRARDPVERLSVALVQLDKSLITPGFDLCKDIEALCSCVASILDVCKLLSVVPIVGTAISSIATQIKNLKIEQAIRDLTQHIRKVLQRVNSVLSKECGS